MARLLIVSRSMALAMRLADQHEVIEHPIDDLESLLPVLDTDVLVLDLGDPVLAVNTVNILREAERDTPVLLVSGYQPEWEQVEAQQVEGVYVVPLPITRVALLQGIAVLTGEESPISFVNSEDFAQPAGSAAERSAPEPPGDFEQAVEAVLKGSGVEFEVYLEPVDEEAVADERGADERVDPDVEPPAEADPEVIESDVAGLSYSTAITRPFDEEAHSGVDPGSPPAWAPQRWLRTSAVPAANPQHPTGVPTEPETGNQNGNGVARRMSRLGNRPRKLQRHPSADSDPLNTPAPGMGLVTDPLGPRTDPHGFGVSALESRLDADAAEMVTARPSDEGGFALRTADLVRMLHARAGDLYGVSDTAQVLADDVIERADADAAAILVPDGPIWRVSGGVGLRPLERRLILEDAHWLITEIGSAGRAVLIEDTDIIRQQLSGAPLAAWRHLLAVPVPDVRAIVVLARGQEGGPFTDRDLSAVIAPVREAASLLAQAVETRRLARVLGPLRESDGDTSPRGPTR